VRRHHVLGLILSLAFGGGVALASPLPIEGLVQTERDFAALSATRDAKTAFLAYLANDGVVFQRGGAISGRTLWRDAPQPTYRLTWRPAHAMAAASGDLGFTTGPYEMRSGEDGSVRSGWYASVWRVQADGGWKLVCDLGAAVKPPATQPADWTLAASDGAADTSHMLGMIDLARGVEELLALERHWADQAQAGGARAVYERIAASRIVLLRAGIEPAIGRDAALAAMSAAPGALQWTPTGGGVSRAGDFGYVYGRFTEASGSEGNYMRAWSRDRDGWHVVLDSFSKDR
jgi:ketosteroid isomerase-like protein